MASIQKAKIDEKKKPQSPTPQQMTVVELVISFLGYGKTYYRKNGEQTSLKDIDLSSGARPGGTCDHSVILRLIKRMFFCLHKHRFVVK